MHPYTVRIKQYKFTPQRLQQSAVCWRGNTPKGKNAKTTLKYKAKLEFLYILPIHRSVRQWSSKPGQASEKERFRQEKRVGECMYSKM
jgi:hypothetical protein